NYSTKPQPIKRRSIDFSITRPDREPALISSICQDRPDPGRGRGVPSFVTEAWQIYILIFLLQSASATFTPAFQAVIPSVLPEEVQYTHAFSDGSTWFTMES